MIITDFHTHSSNSGDSNTPMYQQIESAIEKGLKYLCITEHLDLDYPKMPREEISFDLDTIKYYEEYCKNKEKYASKINLLFGVELGLQPHLANTYEKYVKDWPFDFIIGSSHLCDGCDIYYPSFYEGKDEAACYLRYFESELENINSFSDFDVYGHLDYIVRYGPNKDKYYSYSKYKDIIDEILCKLVDLGKGIEINTKAFKSGMAHPNPCEDILKRYLELGGEIITIGSDAHSPEFISSEFNRAESILKECGFKAYCYFKKRKPYFIDL